MSYKHISANNPALQDRQPRIFLLDATVLQSKRQELPHNANLQAALQPLIQQAEEALQARLVSVIEKKILPESGDMHDYLSLAPYWWPDPEKPDGLPYIHHDGQTNPGAREIPDKPNFQGMMPRVKRLALAYYFTGEERYAAKAADFLRVWFLNPDTAMNPNLNYAQGVRGRSTGRAAGIIDARALSSLIDAIGLLGQTALWTPQDQQGMVDWFRNFLDWLLTSPIGKEEGAAQNNHGSWYDVLTTSAALFIDDQATARAILEASPTRRIDGHILADGRQPRELVRTLSWHYSVFNLEALFGVAHLGERMGVDIWSHATPEGATLRTALDYLVPTALDTQRWTYQHISPIQPEKIVDVLYQAAAQYHEPAYLRIAQQILGSEGITRQENLLYPV